MTNERKKRSAFFTDREETTTAQLPRKLRGLFFSKTGSIFARFDGLCLIIPQLEINFGNQFKSEMTGAIRLKREKSRVTILSSGKIFRDAMRLSYEPITEKSKTTNRMVHQIAKERKRRITASVITMKSN